MPSRSRRGTKQRPPPHRRRRNAAPAPGRGRAGRTRARAARRGRVTYASSDANLMETLAIRHEGAEARAHLAAPSTAKLPPHARASAPRTNPEPRRPILSFSAPSSRARSSATPPAAAPAQLAPDLAQRRVRRLLSVSEGARCLTQCHLGLRPAVHRPRLADAAAAPRRPRQRAARRRRRACARASGGGVRRRRVERRGAGGGGGEEGRRRPGRRRRRDGGVGRALRRRAAAGNSGSTGCASSMASSREIMSRISRSSAPSCSPSPGTSCR